MNMNTNLIVKAVKKLRGKPPLTGVPWLKVVDELRGSYTVNEINDTIRQAVDEMKIIEVRCGILDLVEECPGFFPSPDMDTKEVSK
jgi:hypothetical protein